MSETNEASPANKVSDVERVVMRDWQDVPCDKANECFNGCRYGKGCYVDDLNNAMGGKPWSECYCMTESERTLINIDA